MSDAYHAAVQLGRRKRSSLILFSVLTALAIVALTFGTTYAAIIFYAKSDTATAPAKLFIAEQEKRLTAISHQIHDDLTVHAEASSQRSCATTKLLLDLVQKANSIPNTPRYQRLTDLACRFRPVP